MTTFEVLLQKYDLIVTTEDIAKILRKHVQSIRRDIRNGTFPLRNLSPNSKHTFRLQDVADFIDGKLIVEEKKNVRKGRRVGSKNKPKTKPELMPVPSM